MFLPFYFHLYAQNICQGKAQCYVGQYVDGAWKMCILLNCNTPIPMKKKKTAKLQELSISRAECAGGSLSMEELRQVGWGQVIEGFVGHEEDFEMNSLGDGQPVELIEDGVMWSRVREWVSSRQSSGCIGDYWEFLIMNHIRDCCCSPDGRWWRHA